MKYDDGRAVAENIKAYTYLECSAKTKEGVNEVFVAAVRSIFKRMVGLNLISYLYSIRK